MGKTTLFKTLMNLLEMKKISQSLGVDIVKITIASKSESKVKEELIAIVQTSKTEKEIAEKIQPLKKRYKVA